MRQVISIARRVAYSCSEAACARGRKVKGRRTPFFIVCVNAAMVAAGAVVTPGKIVRSGQLWSGTPAKHMRDLTEKELAYFAYSADHYRKLAERYLARLGSEN